MRDITVHYIFPRVVSAEPCIRLSGCDQKFPWPRPADRGGPLHGRGLRARAEADVSSEGAVSDFGFSADCWPMVGRQSVYDTV